MPAIIAYLVLTAAIGIIVCFFGKALYFPILMCGAFFSCMSGFVGQFGMTWQIVLLGGVVGLLVALLVRFLYKVGVFLMGMFGGAVLGLLLAALLPIPLGAVKGGIVALCALLFGICALRWCDLFIMLATALQGASLIAGSVSFLVMHADSLPQFVRADPLSTMTHLQEYFRQTLPGQHTPLLIGLLAVCAVAGFLVQRTQDRKTG